MCFFMQKILLVILNIKYILKGENKNVEETGKKIGKLWLECDNTFFK